MIYIEVTPQLRRHTLLIAETLPAGSPKVAKHMLNTLPVRSTRVGIEPAKVADGCRDVWPCADRQVHERANRTLVRNGFHQDLLCCVILYSIGRLYCDYSVLESGPCLIMYVPIGSISLDCSKRPLITKVYVSHARFETYVYTWHVPDYSISS